MKIFQLGFIVFSFLFSVSTSFAIEKGFFSDVSQNPYKEAIYHLQEKDIVQGYDDGSFQPEKAINRAEFLKIVVGALYSEELEEFDFHKMCFDDITNPNEWYVPYACLAKLRGIIHGYEGKYLKPENTINLSEAAKIIANTYSTENIQEEGADPWFKPYMQYLLENKLLPPTLIKFDQNLTRGAMAEMISRAVRLQEDTLQEYLDFRSSNYDEHSFLSWEEMTGELQGKTSSETIIDSYNIDRYNRKIVDIQHPGEYVEGAYLSSYDQWTNTDYPPSLDNQTLSVERESEMREDLFRLLNTKREQNDKPTFDFDSVLNTVAQNFAEHLVINAFYSHMDKWGKKPQTRVQEKGYTGIVSESMVWKKSDIQSALDWWENSDLHWNNIMKEKYKNVGIGITEEPDGGYLIILLTGE